jgi:hypothetical protein
LSPVIVTILKNKINITAKAGFPSYVISNHILKIMNGDKVSSNYPIAEIKPGNSIDINIKKIVSNSRIVIENKSGMVIFDSLL